MSAEIKQLVVPNNEAGIRLDSWLAARLTGISRSRIQLLIRTGRVSVAGKPAKESRKTRAGEPVVISFPAARPAKLVPELISLEILFQDSDIIALNKPAGLAVHPSKGHTRGTLAHALLYHYPDLAGIGWEQRPGIVHRLDKDTSGVLLAARNESALASLFHQFKKHEAHKEYLAIARGRPIPDRAIIKTLIGRDPSNRLRMSARVSMGRTAVTHYSTIESSSDHSLLLLRPETGRTHQLRVHLAHAGHPIAGDAKYGTAARHGVEADPPRQMLHAWKLALAHPRTGQKIEFLAPIPRDMVEFMKALGMNPSKLKNGGTLI